MIQKVLRGRGSLSRVSALMDKLSITHPLLVCGDRLAEAFFDKALPAGQCVRFSAYHPNPDFSDCAAGAEKYRREGCDGLISLGGGSAMDTAKAVKALLMADTPEKAMRNELREDAAAVPHIAIPATAGTGSEATETAVMYVDGQKLSLCHPALLPEGVVLDASLLDTLPEYHKKSCALDALCQGIESYWAKRATEDSQVQAYLAIIGVLDNLRPYLAGDQHAAEEMMEAAYRSGRAIQMTRTTAAHAMSYQLTKKLGIAHGHACALTLPILWEQMMDNEDVLPTLMDLASKMRLGSEYMGPRLVEGMLIDLGLEPDAMLDEATLDELADSVNVERLSNHPVPLNREELKSVYRRAFMPKRGPERQACLDIWRYYGQN